jgi:hypothetical protein
MNIPPWARYLIVLLFMGSVFALMYLSLPPDARDKFIWMIQNIGGPLLIFFLVMAIFFRLMVWADGGNHK